jgi:hypothetical protein
VRSIVRSSARVASRDSRLQMLSMNHAMMLWSGLVCPLPALEERTNTGSVRLGQAQSGSANASSATLAEEDSRGRLMRFRSAPPCSTLLRSAPCLRLRLQLQLVRQTLPQSIVIRVSRPAFRDSRFAFREGDSQCCQLAEGPPRPTGQGSPSLLGRPSRASRASRG